MIAETLTTPKIAPMPSGGAIGMAPDGFSSPLKRSFPENRPEPAAVNGTESIRKEGAPPGAQIDAAFLADLEQDMNRLHNVSLKFDLHEATGRTMVKVIDRETEEVIREFPPEKVLDLAAKMEEMLGILFDQKI
jgi:flagellar protein FlaG